MRESNVVILEEEQIIAEVHLLRKGYTIVRFVLQTELSEDCAQVQLGRDRVQVAGGQFVIFVHFALVDRQTKDQIGQIVDGELTEGATLDQVTPDDAVKQKDVVRGEAEKAEDQHQKAIGEQAA